MCTILAALGQHPRFPLLIAANRDEFYDRPFAPPAVLDAAQGAVGGRDLRKGGTWLGVTARGFFVGVTNQRVAAAASSSGLAAPPAEAREALRSRGEVVLRALRAGAPAAVRALVRGLDPRAYAPFNLLWGDASKLFVAYVRPAGVALEELPPGVYALANDRLGAAEFPKSPRAAAALTAALEAARAAGDERWEPLAGPLAALLGEHSSAAADALPAPPPGALPEPLRRALQALCVHTPVYGTVAATLAALGPGVTEAYRFAHGPPCRTRFEDYDYLLRA